MTQKRPPDPALVALSERLLEAWRATVPIGEPGPTTLAMLAARANLGEAQPANLLGAAKLPPLKARASLPPKTKLGLETEIKWKPTDEEKKRKARELPAKLCGLMIDAISARNHDRADAPTRDELVKRADLIALPGVKTATITAAFKLPRFKENVAATSWNKAGDPGAKARLVLRAATDDDTVIGGLIRSILQEKAAATTPTLDPAALTKTGGADLGTPIGDLLQRLQRGHRQIEGVYYLPIKGKAQFFAAEAVRPPLEVARTAPSVAISPPVITETAPPAPTPAEPFEPAFSEAFSHLAGPRGDRLVKLHDLRRALPQFSRESFDSGLHRLRESRRYWLEGHDGRHGVLSEAERHAGIEERGAVKIYVARSN